MPLIKSNNALRNTDNEQKELSFRTLGETAMLSESSSSMSSCEEEEQQHTGGGTEQHSKHAPHNKTASTRRK